MCSNDAQAFQGHSITWTESFQRHWMHQWLDKWHLFEGELNKPAWGHLEWKLCCSFYSEWSLHTFMDMAPYDLSWARSQNRTSLSRGGSLDSPQHSTGHSSVVGKLGRAPGSGRQRPNVPHHIPQEQGGHIWCPNPLPAVATTSCLPFPPDFNRDSHFPNPSCTLARFSWSWAFQWKVKWCLVIKTKIVSGSQGRKAPAEAERELGANSFRLPEEIPAQMLWELSGGKVPWSNGVTFQLLRCWLLGTRGRSGRTTENEKQQCQEFSLYYPHTSPVSWHRAGRATKAALG